MDAFSFRLATEYDLPAIVDIFNHEILTSTCTFRTSPVDLANRRTWLSQLQQASYPCYIVEHTSASNEEQTADPQVVGWCNLGCYRPAEAYSTTTEASLYIRQDFRGQGLGTRLFEIVLSEARTRRYQTILAMVAMENESNRKFWEKQGFRQVGILKQVGKKFNKWLDVGIYQLMV